ncbi:hypothetical protein BDW42DRAFT_169100 [Aspergillus taichungensis]|uniref:RRM domain-containing protein n=1 Tax=Aspergillus taichungensis TaxID=482145 RepID=A0A2J5HV66_9EURO|nr:hypothetical protein BDW42DRAFT_169100 [Aspergillus taichungensis]
MFSRPSTKSRFLICSSKLNGLDRSLVLLESWRNQTRDLDLRARLQKVAEDRRSFLEHICARYQTLLHSMNTDTATNSFSLNENPYILDTVSNIVREMSRCIQLATAETQENKIDIHLTRINHAIDRLFALTPVCLNPGVIGEVHDNTVRRFDGFDFSFSTTIEDRITSEINSLVSSYDTRITARTKISSEWQRHVTMELIESLQRHLLEMSSGISQQYTTFADTTAFDVCLKGYVAEYEFSPTIKKLNQIHISSEFLGMDIPKAERMILQAAKKLRLLRAPSGQCILKFVLASTDTEMLQSLTSLAGYVSHDRAVSGVIVVEVTSFDVFVVRKDTYPDLLLPKLDLVPESLQPGDLMHLNSGDDRLWEIEIRNLSQHTEYDTLRFELSVYGHIEDLSFTKIPIVPEWTLYRHAMIPGVDSTESPPTILVARMVYRNKMDAETACEHMDGMRFDGAIIHVFVRGLLNSLDPIIRVAEDKGAWARSH